MIAELFGIIAPVAVCALIGFLWSKKGMAFDTEQVTALVTYVGTPCLVFSALTTVEISNAAFSEMALASFVTVVLFAAIGTVALRLFGQSLRAYLPPLVWANIGNMGLPLCLFAFGQEGLALAVTYFAMNILLMFGLSVPLVSGEFSLKSILKLPFIHATWIALIFMLSDLHVPRWIADTTDLLGGLTIPLMLIMLGISLASLKTANLSRATWISVLRLVMGFLVGWGTAWAFDLEGAARGVLIVECAMPVAVFNYLFAMRYNQAPSDIAGTVLISTTLSFATLPLLLWFVL